jgi:hypothetical protein
MRRRDEAASYRQHAAHCLELARGTLDMSRRSALLDMAQVWLDLADQAEKNAGTDLVYETPRPSSEKSLH